MIEHEIEPWIVSLNGNQIAMWQLNEPQAAALAFFSERSRAEEYARGLNAAESVVLQPSRRELLGLMIQCYQQQILYAVLDPDTQSARRIFKLREVLKAAKDK